MDQNLKINFIKQAIKSHKFDEDYYSIVMSTMDLTHDFFYSNIEIFDLHYLIKYCKLKEETIQYFIDDDSIDIEYLLIYQQLSENQLKQYIADKPNWELILEYQTIPCSIMQANKKHIDWALVSENQFMDLEFLISNINKIDWEQLPFNTRMKPFINEGIISLFHQTNIWENIAYTNIDIDVLLKYKHKFTVLSWDGILEFRDLTEEQREEFQKYRQQIVDKIDL